MRPQSESELSLDALRLPGVGTYSWYIGDDRLEWSAGLLEIYGLASAPASEPGFTALIHPDDRVRVEAETSSFLEGRTAYEHEFRILRPDGEVRFVNDRGVVERDETGRAVAIHGMNVDVTRQRMPQVFPDGTEDLVRFRRLADNIDQLVWMADASGFVYWYNKRCYDFTGLSFEVLKGWGFTAVHHPDHLDRVVEGYLAAIANGQPWEDTFPMRGRNGDYRWFLTRAKPVRGPDGQITHWFGSNTDVTDRREAEVRLRQSEERFKRMADSMPQLVWCAAADGRSIYFNRKVTQFAPVIDTGTGGFDWSELIHPDDLAETRDCWTAALASGGEYVCEHRLMLADGSWRWHLSRAVVAPGDDVADAMWFGTSTDIHELKELQEHRLLLTQELDHRMKNALTLVQSIANQTFRSMGGDMEAVAAFNGRLRALAAANDILVHGDWSEADVGEICRRTVAPLGIHDRVEMSGATLKVPLRMGFLLSLGLHELATNAIKHGSLGLPDGRVSLTWHRDEDADGAFGVIWEERNGPPVATPATEGFGSRLLKSALAAEIDGEVEITFGEAGLLCRIKGHGALTAPAPRD